MDHEGLYECETFIMSSNIPYNFGGYLFGTNLELFLPYIQNIIFHYIIGV